MLYICFNPHTHEGCDYQLIFCASYSNGFNPHTHEGCDYNFILLSSKFFCFNPHTHEGCDSLVCLMISSDDVSIHTPTKGVTPEDCSCIFFML